MNLYKGIYYDVNDYKRRPFHAWYNSRWHFFKKYETMMKAIDEHLKAKEAIENGQNKPNQCEKCKKWFSDDEFCETGLCEDCDLEETEKKFCPHCGNELFDEDFI